LDLFTAPQNLPFSVSILLMLVLAAIEAVGVLVGAGLFHHLDAAIYHGDMDADVHGDGFLGWLHLGKVPLLVLLIVFLTTFGVVGLLVQAVSKSILGSYWPGAIAAIPAVVLALPAVRGFGTLFGRLMPKDETSAVSEDTLIGRIATITVGVARAGQPAEGRVRDQHGQSHYVMVEPDIPGETFPAGTEVLLVKRLGARFSAIRNPSAALSDRPH
jgi:membrane protein implicated in regulation of membrane protease activity